MNRLSIMFIAGLIAAGAQIVTAQQNPAFDKLFAGAQHKAAVEGDLKGAIEDYKVIVARAGANRAVAAEALLRMAEAYQNLGATEAKSTYERIVRDYGDQKEAVVTARAKLGGLRTLVWADAKADGNAGVSRDGRHVAFIDWATGDLWTRELASGVMRRITNDGDLGRSPGTYAGRSVFSPQGDRIAFAWFDQDRGRYHVRLASTTRTSVPGVTVIYESEDSTWVQPYDWSADGRWIALQIERADRTGQIAVYDTQRGSVQVLKSVPWEQASNRLQFSPDGRFLAFDLYQRQNQRDIHVLATDGSRDVEAVVHPADDELLGWSPDGSRLLFFSDRSGPAGLWTLGIREGRPSGSPRLVRPALGVPGRFAPLGLTADGSLVYMTSRPGGCYRDATRVSNSLLRTTCTPSPGAAVASRLPCFGAFSPGWSPRTGFRSKTWRLVRFARYSRSQAIALPG
jgi:Tol biopolymer transport system component